MLEILLPTVCLLSLVLALAVSGRSSARAIEASGKASAEMQRNPQVKSLVERLESDYDARRARQQQNEGPEEPPAPADSSELPPSVEQFLRELDQTSPDGESDSETRA